MASNYLKKTLEGGASRRGFLVGGLVAAVIRVAVILSLPSIACAEQPYYSNIPVLDVNELTYKDWIQKNIVGPKKDVIIVYCHLRMIPKIVKEQGEEELKDIENWERFLENEIAPRVPVYRIEMQNWSRDSLMDWTDNVNERRFIPSYHVYFNGELRARVRGCPSHNQLSQSKRELESYLKPRTK